jgi:hypothetical protein
VVRAERSASRPCISHSLISMPFSHMSPKSPSRCVIPSSSRTCLPRLISSRHDPPRLGAHVEAHQRAQSHAVHTGQVGQVENDALVPGNQSANFRGKLAAHPGNQLAAAADVGCGPLFFDAESECFRGGCVRNRSVPSIEWRWKAGSTTDCLINSGEQGSEKLAELAGFAGFRLVRVLSALLAGAGFFRSGRRRESRAGRQRAISKV